MVVDTADTALRFVMYAFAIYRITLLLYYDNGPWDIIDWMRYKAGVEVLYTDLSDKGRRVATNRHIGALLNCPYCLSFYVTVLFALAWFQHSYINDGIVFVIALWGLVTLLLERSKLAE